MTVGILVSSYELVWYVQRFRCWEQGCWSGDVGLHEKIREGKVLKSLGTLPLEGSLGLPDDVKA